MTQQKARTANEVLDELTFEAIKWKYGAVSAEVRGLQYKAQRQLFEAILEIVGADDLPYSRGLPASTSRNRQRNELRTELRQKLKVFFDQLEEKV